jgi:signal transduction histidine kinase
VALFRIVQECLTNIHRHSGSKTATILFSRRPDSVCVEILDKGRGMPAGRLAEVRAQRAGVGITGMRERVRHLGGVMDIHSGDGGTKISVVLPVSASAVSESETIDAA